jgi:nitrite reductase/ring-hydroxylating ferredoxin subunit
MLQVGKESIAVFNNQGRYSAVHNVCKHQNGPLAEGKIVNGCITCPWHGWQYELATGNHAPTCKPMLKTYRIGNLNTLAWCVFELFYTVY